MVALFERVLAMAVGFLEEAPSEIEREGLSRLVEAALESLEARLLPEHTAMSTAAAFVPAAAFTALAAFLTARGASVPLAGVTAGEVSVRYSEGGDAARQLLEQADRLLLGLVADGGFAFRGVRG